jgi:hypothetical protein
MTKALRPFLTHGKADHEAAWDRLRGNGRFVTHPASQQLHLGCRVHGRERRPRDRPVSTMVWLSTVIFVGTFALIMVIAGAAAKEAGEMVAREADADVKLVAA